MKIQNTVYDGKVNEKAESPIDRLAPNGPHAQWVVEQLTRRIKASEDEMSKFYPRWRVAERKFQAYMSLPRYEQILKDMNNSGKPPAPAIIVFPYQYAVISTIVTYLMRVFAGRKPIFQLGATSPEAANIVQNMETVLQYQADYQKLVMRLYQFFMDGELYGLAAMRNIWVEKRSMRTQWSRPSGAALAVGMSSAPVSNRIERLVYQGAEISNIDPFMFFPDPTVPIAEVGTKGEFVFWREFQSRHVLIAEQRQGKLSWVDDIEPISQYREGTWFNLSNRNLLAGGQAHAGQQTRKSGQDLQNVFMVDQGTVTIIPQDWGLGPEEYPVRYLFTLINKRRVVQAEPLEADADCHPLVTAEPYSMGYQFGNAAITDYLGPIQDIMSWFIDSHIQNVRAVLNDQLLVDPSKIEMADLKRPAPGRIIRLKATAIGTDVRTAISQLPIRDVTAAHMTDLSTFMRIGDTVSAVNDNMRGLQQNNSGRRSATEVRLSGEAGASRLASHAQLYSSQAIAELARQMTLNTQQWQTEEVYLKVLGGQEFQKLGPLNLMGDFVFPVHDGTLPIDKMATMEVWKEIFIAMQSDQELRQTFSVPKVFEFIAELGGAVNISSFKMMPNPGAQPNMMPLNELPPPEQPNFSLGVPAQAGINRPVPRFKVGA